MRWSRRVTQTREQFFIFVRQKCLSAEVWLLVMGGGQIHVSFWPFSNFTHQREHHPAAGMPESERERVGDCRNLEDFQRFAHPAPSYLSPRREEKVKVKAQWYVWSYEYLTFMLQQAVRWRLLILHRSPCRYFFFFPLLLPLRLSQCQETAQWHGFFK